MKGLIKNFAFLFLILLMISAVFSLFSTPFETQETLAVTQIVNDINQDKIKKITVSGNKLVVLYQDDTEALSYKEAESALSQSLINYGVEKEKLSKVIIETQETYESWFWILSFFSSIVPLLLFGWFSCMIFKQSKT